MNRLVWLASLLLLLIAGCKVNSNKQYFADKGNRVENKALVGTWIWTREVNDCTEVWRFYEDGKLVVISGREVTLSEYSLSDTPNEAGRYLLTTTILVDHGGIDCADSTDDSTGDIYANYILFHESGKAYFPMYHPIEDDGFGPLYRLTD